AWIGAHDVVLLRKGEGGRRVCDLKIVHIRSAAARRGVKHSYRCSARRTNVRTRDRRGQLNGGDEAGGSAAAVPLHHRPGYEARAIDRQRETRPAGRCSRRNERLADEGYRIDGYVMRDS